VMRHPGDGAAAHITASGLWVKAKMVVVGLSIHVFSSGITCCIPRHNVFPARIEPDQQGRKKRRVAQWLHT
jgi:hypothetical protein